jgi:hypothetical protein
MNRYRVLLPLLVHTADNAYAQGDEFEQEFTAEDEATNLASGLLELLPNTYRVVGGSEVHGAKPGETFTMPLPLGQEALLVQGGHIERVDDTPVVKKSSKSKES